MQIIYSVAADLYNLSFVFSSSFLLDRLKTNKWIIINIISWLLMFHENNIQWSCKSVAYLSKKNWTRATVPPIEKKSVHFRAPKSVLFLHLFLLILKLKFQTITNRVILTYSFTTSTTKYFPKTIVESPPRPKTGNIENVIFLYCHQFSPTRFMY